MPKQPLSDIQPLEQVEGLLSRNWPPLRWCQLNVAVALSGGCDSMTLLRAVLRLKHQHCGPGRVTALHVDHQLRGRESEADATWCEAQCKLLEVPLRVLRGVKSPDAHDDGDGLENAAREHRYRLLAEAAEQDGVRYVATAHTQNDQVETVLFRLMRGSGMRGLAGIPSSRMLTPAVTLVRPLLDCSRKQLECYLAALNQDFRVDSSNRDTRLTRNRLRHELLPQLRTEYNIELDAALLRIASHAEGVQRFLEKQGQLLLDKARVADSDITANKSITLRCGPLTRQDSVVVCEALRLAWRDSGLPEQEMTFDWWRRLAERVSEPRSGGILNLPGAVRASIVDDCLVIQW